MESVFSASALLVFPFWFAMMAVPRWRLTRKVMGSPAVVLGAVALYACLVLPALTTVLPVVVRPTLGSVMALLGQPAAATAAWAHFLAFDLFVGRWIYLDALERKLPWPPVAASLVLTLLLGPLGLASYLVLRKVGGASAWTRVGRATRDLWSSSRPLVLVGLASLALLAGALILQVVDRRMVLGVSTWVKPAKFAASVAIAAFTLAWMIGQLDPQARGLRRAAMIIASMAALELAIITIQAARGVPSHFNARTRLDVIAFAVMGAGITIFWLAQGFVFVRALRHRFADAAVGWGIRLGLGVALGGGAIAFLMTQPTPAQLTTLRAGQLAPALGAHAVGVPDGGPGLPVTRWSTEGGDLRVPHFMGLHALQLLPLAGVLFARGRRRAIGRGADETSAATRAKAFTLAVGVGYLGLTVVMLVQALRAQPLLAPDALTLLLAGLALLPAVVVAAAVRVRSPGLRPRLTLSDSSP